MTTPNQTSQTGDAYEEGFNEGLDSNEENPTPSQSYEGLEGQEYQEGFEAGVEERNTNWQ